MRGKIRKRILVFSVGAAFGIFVLVVVILIIFKIAQPYFSEMKNIHEETFKNIDCKESVCNIEKWTNYPSEKSPDYILTKERFFIYFTNDYPEFELNFSDPDFLRKFREPESYTSPVGEQWRLYSRNASINNRNIEIIVGWTEKTPARIAETLAPPEVNPKLKEEADNIADKLTVNKGEVFLSEETRPKVDSYQVVDTESKKVISWAWSMPAFFPKEKQLPRQGLSFFRRGNELYLVRTDYEKELIATSLKSIGNLWQFAGLICLIFLFIFSIFYIMSLTFLKKYFIFSDKKPTSVIEALKHGEGQKIEFKSVLTEDDVLKSITAFANTNDGTIFIGINDEGHIVGLDAHTPKAKDKFRDKILNLIRNKIKPYALVDIDFEEVRDFLVAKIFVPRGEEMLYCLNGIIYVRDGNSDTRAQPEIIKKIVSQYTF